MKNRFIPIGKGRAERIRQPEQEQDESKPIVMAWANSKAEAELMDSMTDEELERYLQERSRP